MAVTSTYTLQIDWDNDGDFWDATEDISSYVLAGPGVSWGYGRNNASQLTGRSTAGTFSCTLLNSDGRFSSFNASSPLTGSILPGRMLRFFGMLENETFNRSDGNIGTSDTGNVWTVQQGDIDVVSNAAKGINAANNIATINVVDANVRVRGTVTLNSANQEAGIIIRYTDASNYWLVSAKATANEFKIVEYNGGTPTTRASAAPTISTATAYLIEVEANGSAIYARFNSTNTISYTTATFNVTKQVHGMMLQQNCTLDNYRVDVWLWQGYLESIIPVIQTGPFNTARLSAGGPISWLNDPRRQTSMGMYTNIATGTAVTNILDAISWSTPLRSIDAGSTTMARYWSPEQSALLALRQVEDTEAGFLRETKSGIVAFDGRQHRLNSPYTTSQVTFSDAGAPSYPYLTLEQEDAWAEIYNRFETDVQYYTIGSVAVLWTLQESGSDSPPIFPGETRTFTARYPDVNHPNPEVGVDSWTTPISTTDYTANSAADGTGTNLTSSIGISVVKSSQAMEVSLTNNHGSLIAYVTFLRARGTPITATDPVRIFSQDTTSQTTYGKRTFPNPGKYIPDSIEAKDWADYNLSTYKDPIPTIKMSFSANRDYANLRQALIREIDDRITVVAENNAKFGINRDFFIEAIRHRLGSGRYHVVEFHCSPITSFAGTIVLDTGPGLDTGRAGY